LALQGGGYLAASRLRALETSTQPEATSEAAALGACAPDPDAEAAPQALSRWAYNVLYSPSYGEPVLYFEAHDQSGSPLPLAHVLASLRLEGGAAAEGATSSVQLPAVTLSQEDHPLLGRPFYLLHPCRTGDVMGRLLGPRHLASGDSVEAAAAGATAEPESSSLRYLLAWMCVAGQPVGLSPSPEHWNVCLRGALASA
jgi:ubiquitin-like-conjugating enzyme ATG10